MLVRGDLVNIDAVMLGASNAGNGYRLRARRAVLEVAGDQVKVLDHRWQAIWLPASLCQKEELDHGNDEPEQAPVGRGKGGLHVVLSTGDTRAMAEQPRPGFPPWAVADRPAPGKGRSRFFGARASSSHAAFGEPAGSQRSASAACRAFLERSRRARAAVVWLTRRGGVYVVLGAIIALRIVGIFLGWWQL